MVRCCSSDVSWFFTFVSWATGRAVRSTIYLWGISEVVGRVETGERGGRGEDGRRFTGLWWRGGGGGGHCWWDRVGKFSD